MGVMVDFHSFYWLVGLLYIPNYKISSWKLIANSSFFKIAVKESRHETNSHIDYQPDDPGFP
jgi:hypothetical protein